MWMFPVRYIFSFWLPKDPTIGQSTGSFMPVVFIILNTFNYIQTLVVRDLVRRDLEVDLGSLLIIELDVSLTYFQDFIVYNWCCAVTTNAPCK